MFTKHLESYTYQILTKGLVLLDELDDESTNEIVKEIVYNVEKETNVKASLDINKSEEFTSRVIEKLAAKFSITASRGY